jgi:hypothetical protein
MAREVREGQTEGGLPYLSFGEGLPLVVFPGLGIRDLRTDPRHRWGPRPLLPYRPVQGRRFGKDVLAFLLADQTDALRSGGRSVLTG